MMETPVDSQHIDSKDIQTMRQLETSTPDQLVELVPGQKEQCQVTTYIDSLESTNVEGSLISTGTMFSVTAIESIEILSFEFSHSKVDGDLGIEIYTLAGSDYKSQRKNKDAWKLLSATGMKGVPSSDKGEKWKIAPRAEMKESVVMASGETRSFYFSLLSQHLLLMENKLTNSVYKEDSKLRVNSGIGVRARNFPDTTDDDNLAFQGRIHYRSTAACTTLTQTTTKVQVPFVVDSTAVPSSTAVYQTEFENMIKTAAENTASALARWQTNDGLQMISFSPQAGETKADCSAHGVNGPCATYTNEVSFKHYPTLSSKEVELEIISTIIDKNDGSISFGNTNATKMIYSGDPIIKGFYGIQLVGVPSDTILNPIQNNYISSIMYEFLEEFSTVKPNKVDVTGQLAQRRRRQLSGDGALLRGISRRLQLGVITAESVIYLVGTNANEFYTATEKAISSENQQLKARIQLDHNRPGAINDRSDTNIGAIFNDLVRVSVKSNVTSSSGSGTTATSDDDNLGLLIVCSVLIGLSILFLCYSIRRDYFGGKNAYTKGETLTEKKEREQKEEAIAAAVEKKENSEKKPPSRDEMSADSNPQRKKKPPSGKRPNQADNGGGKPNRNKQKKRPGGGRPQQKNARELSPQRNRANSQQKNAGELSPQRNRANSQQKNARELSPQRNRANSSKRNNRANPPQRKKPNSRNGKGKPPAS